MASTYSTGELYYDRSENLSGIPSALVSDYDPTYGSSVTFSSALREYRQDDNYFYLHPKDINSLNASYQVVFKEDGEDAIKLVNELEKKGGHIPFYLKSDPDVYKNTYGYCDSYSVTHKSENSFEIRVDFNADEIPNFFKWKSKSYVNFPFKNWDGNSKSYKKNDVVYYKSPNRGAQNKMYNFFYCTKDNVSNELIPPNAIIADQESPWTQEFCWCPDANWQNSVSFDVSKFQSDFKQREKNRNNIATFPIEYKFTAIDTKQLKAMLHFLETRGGYQRFKHSIPSLYNRPKVLIATEWTHNWLGCDSHELSIKMKEDPLGALSTDYAEKIEVTIPT